MMRIPASGLLAVTAVVASLSCDFKNAYSRCVAAGRCPSVADTDGGSAGGGSAGGGSAADAGPRPSLTSLSPSNGRLNPDFTAGATSYQLVLPRGVTTVSLTASAATPNTTVELDGVALASGVASAPLSIGLAPRALSIVVGDADGSTTYTIVVARSATLLKASNTGPGDLYGSALALSSDGSTLAVGAPGEGSAILGAPGDDSAPSSGAVYVFARTGSGWTQTAYLKASNPDSGDNFGGHVALSSNGTTLAVGAVNERSGASGINANQADNTIDNAGAAYVFTLEGSTWTQQAYIKPSNPSINAYFAVDVALSGDGSTLAVGGLQESTTAVGSGAVYIFTRAGATWSERAKIKAAHPSEYDHFGCSVSLSSDGTRFVAGADYEDSSASGVGGDQTNDALENAGAAYVFVGSGSTWTQEAYLKGSSPAAYKYFGTMVALSKDGSTIAAGSSWGDPGVHVFVRTGTSWAQEASLKAAHGEVVDLFGKTVSISADGSTLAVGAPDESSSATGINGDESNDRAAQAGAAYLFTRVQGTWTQSAYLKGFWAPDATDHLGTGLALSADGRWLAIGAPEEDSCSTGVVEAEGGNGCLQAGAVSVY